MQSKETYRGLPSKSLVLVGFVSIRNYLKSRRWQTIDGSHKAATFKHPTLSSVQVTIPLAQSYSDYAERIGDAIATVAATEDRNPFEVFTDIMLPPSDVMRFSCVEADTVTGTVPFEAGLELFDGVKQILVSAALAAERHQRYYPRMSGGSDVDEFIARCLLGQTEVGSFTATFICPVQEHPERVVQDFFDPIAMNTPDPFARLVTRNIMAATDSLVNAIRDDKVKELLAGDVAPISANLCEALLQMKPAHDGKLTIAASWARTLPPPPSSIATRVDLPSDYFSTIRDVGAALRPAAPQVPPQFVGHVIELSRHDAEGPLEGPVKVTLLVIYEGRAVRVKVDLESTDYPTARKAFEDGTYVSIEGDLARSARVSNFRSYRNFKGVE